MFIKVVDTRGRTLFVNSDRVYGLCNQPARLIFSANTQVGEALEITEDSAGYFLQCVEAQDAFTPGDNQPEPMSLTTRLAIYLRDTAPNGATLREIDHDLRGFGNPEQLHAAGSALYEEKVIVILEDGRLLHKSNRSRVLTAAEIATMDRAALSDADRAALDKSAEVKQTRDPSTSIAS